MIEFDNLIKLINTVSGSNLTGFRYEADGIKLRMSKECKKKTEIVTTGSPFAAAAVTEEAKAAAVDSPDETSVSGKPDGNILTSPLVGTFYAAPSEDAKPFVSVGDAVKKGQTLAIIEAMKLMNEIECECDGTVAEILAENGQPVEYGQPLFRITGGLS